METNEKIYPVSVAFACNDDHGNFEGTFTAVEIGDDLLRLENSYDPARRAGLKFKINKIYGSGGFGASKAEGFVYISKRKFPILGYKGYWGNIIWDMVIVSPESAMQIIDYLKSLGTFSVDSGCPSFGDKFESEGAFEWTNAEIELLKTEGYRRP